MGTALGLNRTALCGWGKGRNGALSESSRWPGLSFASCVTLRNSALLPLWALFSTSAKVRWVDFEDV